MVKSKKINILYIEDDPTIAEIYIFMIKEIFVNVEIEWMTDGFKAIQDIKKNPNKYKLIISDYKLPIGSGGEIFQTINGQMLGIPFIILSGFDCSTEPEFNGFFNSHVRNAVLVKPASINDLTEKIKWCLGSESDLLKIYNREASSCDEKIAINSDVFLRLNLIPCDVYLKLNDGKYVKIINKKEIFERALIQKLIIKGTNYFYVNRSELSNYSDTVIKSLASIVKVKKNKADEIQKSQLNNKAINLLKNNLLVCGFSEAHLEATDEVVNLQLDLIKSATEVNEFLEKFQLFRKASADHTRIVSYILVSILKDLTWDSESTLHRMCLASLLHDVTLTDDFFNKTLNLAEIEEMSEENKKIYFRHPEESSHIAKNFDSTAAGIDQYILEHHELPNGKGFPRKLTYNHVHPLSAVLHLSDFVADLLWEYNFDTDLIAKKIREQKEFYLRGFYRKPFEAICRMFKVPGK